MGQFQVSQPAFVAFAAYSSALVSLNAPGIPFVLTALIGILVAIVVALLIGPVFLRLQGVFLALASFALVGLVVAATYNIAVIGGAQGLFNVPRRVGTYPLLLIALLVVALLAVLKRSPFGVAMRAIADDPLGAGGSGINVKRMHLYVFTVSAAIAGLAGVLRVHLFFTVNPSEFGLVRILDMLAFVIIGGTGSVLGPLIGAIVVTLLGEGFRSLEEWRVVLNGVLLLVIVLFLPGGLVSLRLPTFLRRRKPVAKEAVA